MKKLIIATVFFVSPAGAGEYFHDWNDEFRKGQEEIYRGLTTPVTPGPMASSPEYQPGYNSPHLYSYSDENGVPHNVWVRRLD